MKAEENIISGQSSWIVENGNVRLALTRKGGHMAPVFFYSDTKSPVQPYYINPWAEEKIKLPAPVLEPLRGDFFCMPFGAVNDYKNESHDVHGEPAAGTWKTPKLTGGQDAVHFSVTMNTKTRPGTITKNIILKEGHNAVYIEHLLEGYSGKMTLGHHPTLALPGEEGGMRISTGPILFGYTAPRPKDALVYAGEEYYALAPNVKFSSLKKVPTVWKEVPFADCSAFPLREGFVDIIGIAAKPGPKPHWTAAVVPSGEFLWFSLKNPTVLPVTVFWMANKGRHGSPWNGRNRCIGLEDICGYLAQGLTESAKKNPLSAEGVPTAVTLSPSKPLSVRHIQGVVKVPKKFDRVSKVRFDKGSLAFGSESGAVVEAPVDWDFLQM